MKKDKKQIAKITVFITSIFIIFMSVSYAFINLTLEGTKRQVITVGTLDLVLDEDENNLTIENALPMYDEVGMLQDAFTFRLINNGTTSANYVLKLVETKTGTLSKSNVKYALTKDGETKIALLSSLTEGIIDRGTIEASPATIEYSLRLWIKDTVKDNSLIADKSLSYRVDVEVSQQMEYTVATNTNELVEAGTTGDNCKTYDDGVDTFLVGQCSNNYVWYSGKLWRVVLKNNETGAVKMVTDNAVTVISYNDSESPAFENSYMDQWLNQEFLPTLHDYENYLVTDYLWDATDDSSNEPTSRPGGATTVERVVGLLNTYEYYTTYAQSGGLATRSNGYLVNGGYWRLLTPHSSADALESLVKEVFPEGFILEEYSTASRGVRPSVNLKSGVQIDSGSGSQNDPYILKGDVQETVAGTTLLSTRYSGEYVTFNNELYRIVGAETIDGKTLTKITAVDTPSTLTNLQFHSVNGTSNFENVSIKTDLETYYQSLKTDNPTAYEMIQPNTTWYLGADRDGNYHYKTTICATVDASTSTLNCEKIADTSKLATASIALPRVGEMFTSQITRDTREKADFWSLTPYGSTQVRIVQSGRLVYAIPSGNRTNARPSMYLKSNVVIASDNTGNGTYEYPYKIELGA